MLSESSTSPEIPPFPHKTATYHKDCLQISVHSTENTVTFHMQLLDIQLAAQHSFIIS